MSIEFKSCVDQLGLHDSLFSNNNYGVGRRSGRACAVGDRIFVWLDVEWYGMVDGVKASYSDAPANGSDSRGIALWHVLDVDLDAGTYTKADTWRDHAGDEFEVGETPVLFRADPIASPTVHIVAGDGRNLHGANWTVVGENSEYHWVSGWFTTQSNLQNDSTGCLVTFKVRKSDGKMFTPSGTPGFPDARNGDMKLVDENQLPGVVYWDERHVYGPVRTSQGLLVGTVCDTDTADHALQSWLFGFNDSTGVGSLISTENTTLVADETVRPSQGGGSMDSFYNTVTHGDVTVFGSPLYDWNEIEEASLYVSIGGDGAVLDTLVVPWRHASDSRLVKCRGGILVPCMTVTTNWDYKRFIELFVGVNWTTGALSYEGWRPGPAPWDGEVQDYSGSTQWPPDGIIPMAVRGGGGGGGYLVVGSNPFDSHWDQVARISTHQEVVEEVAFDRTAQLFSAPINHDPPKPNNGPITGDFPIEVTRDITFHKNRMPLQASNGYGFTIFDSGYRVQDPMTGTNSSARQVQNLAVFDFFHEIERPMLGPAGRSSRFKFRW